MLEFTPVFFESLQSTNETAKTYPPYTVIRAAVQSKGKGRTGRVWHSPNGNLYMSVVLPYTGDAPFYSFIAGLAVAASIAHLSPRLKWPNDVLIDGQKIAGILLETTIDEPQKLIIGIGVNVVNSPKQDMLYPTTSLQEQGSAVAPEVLMNIILQNLSDVIDLFQKTGFTQIKRQWLEFAIGIGQAITVRLPHQEIKGIFEALDDQGALLLRLPDTTQQRITAGDVFMI